MPRNAATTDPALSIHFQGICFFLRHHHSQPTEVTVVLVAAEQAKEDPKLCRHSPVLVFRATDFLGSSGIPSHITALAPGQDRSRPGLGIWPLAGKDLKVVGASRRALVLDRSFSATADLDELTGNGAASRESIELQPPLESLVAGRVTLTSGKLSVTACVEDNWVFDEEHAEPTNGTIVHFAQEVRYDFFAQPPPAEVTLKATWMGDDSTKETLVLKSQAKIAICNLCPVERKRVIHERDFLAYYALLSDKVSPRLIPHRLPARILRIGSSACPPATTFLAGSGR